MSSTIITALIVVGVISLIVGMLEIVNNRDRKKQPGN